MLGLLFDAEDWGSATLRNVCKLLRHYMASHPRCAFVPKTAYSLCDKGKRSQRKPLRVISVEVQVSLERFSVSQYHNQPMYKSIRQVRSIRIIVAAIINGTVKV